MIFEPSWTLQMGEQSVNGVGVLGKQRPPDDLIELFSVTMNGTQVVVLPKEGKIVQNLHTIWQGSRGTLIWLRRMKMLLGPQGESTECEYYGIGLQIGENRIGFKLFEDGRVESGLYASI